MEALDNGKSIRETRDADTAVVVRHLYHYAGWAQLLSTELAGWTGVGVVGAIVPWNFPLMLLVWKARIPSILLPKILRILFLTCTYLLGRPCPRRGQHGGPEARDLHAAVRAAVRRDLRGGGAAGRGLQRGDGGRRHGPGAGRAPARGQGGTLPMASLLCFSWYCLYPRLRSPGLPRLGRCCAGPRLAPARRSRWSWAASPRSWCSTPPTSTPRWRASWTRSGSTRAR